jgi:plasmid maintenance system antidote protein VapI
MIGFKKDKIENKEKRPEDIVLEKLKSGEPLSPMEAFVYSYSLQNDPRAVGEISPNSLVKVIKINTAFQNLIKHKEEISAQSDLNRLYDTSEEGWKALFQVNDQISEDNLTSNFRDLLAERYNEVAVVGVVSRDSNEKFAHMKSLNETGQNILIESATPIYE